MQPEFSRIIKLEDIGKEPFVQSIEADGKERAALSKRIGVEAIDVFKAKVTLQWKDAKHLELTADFKATVLQTCIRTADRLKQKLKGHVEEVFTTDPLPFQEEEMDLEALLAEPEPLVSDEIDFGEILSQHLCLDLNPYAVQEESEPVEHVESKTKTPFDRLKDLL